MVFFVKPSIFSQNILFLLHNNFEILKCAIFLAFGATRQTRKNMREEGVQMRHFGANAPNLETLLGPLVNVWSHHSVNFQDKSICKQFNFPTQKVQSITQLLMGVQPVLAWAISWNCEPPVPLQPCQSLSSLGWPSSCAWLTWPKCAPGWGPVRGRRARQGPFDHQNKGQEKKVILSLTASNTQVYVSVTSRSN